MDKMFETVAVGGTFDVLHRGHRKLIMKAFEIGNHVLIGLCSDAFLKKLMKPHGIAPYAQRLEELKNFLKQKLCWFKLLFSVPHRVVSGIHEHD